MKPKLILVGGFLGAGKTTPLLIAPNRLRETLKPEAEHEGLRRTAQLLVNARVELTPEALEVQSLSPGRPQPMHRYDRVV